MADDKPKAGATGETVQIARKRFERAKSFYAAARVQSVADTRFALGDSDNGYQWPADMKRQRELSQKVCLTVNITAQHCNQIINQVRQNRPGCKVTPVDGGADRKTAEMLAGLWRNIRAASGADDASDIAAEHAIYGGEGYWRVVTEYESELSFDQVIRIKQIRNPQLVLIDPDSTEADRSDAKWGFVFEDVPKEDFEREYPGIDPASWTEEVKSTGWADADKVRIAEYFYLEHKADTAYLLPDGSVVLKSEAGEVKGAVDERPVQVPQWRWCKLVGGHDQPVSARDWPGRYLPIITVVGKEVDVDGEIVRKGIVRDLKDPARMVNYSFSETIQTVALQNKAPYLAAAEAIEGYEDEWAKANGENLAYLPYNAYDDDGNPLPQPQRQAPPMMAEAQVKTLALSVEQMRAASGQQNANFGIKSEAQSGIGIRRLQAQGEVATFHFPDNLRRALRYEGKVVIDLIQKVYDTPRVVRILGLDGKEQQANLDPTHEQPYSEVKADDEVQRIFNPTVGMYDVVIDTGPSYQTQREEAFSALMDLAGRDPNLMQVAGDLIMSAGDFPMADQMSKRLAKTIPANLREGEEVNAADKLQMQLAQASQQMQQMVGRLEELAAENDEMRRTIEAKLIEARTKVAIVEKQEETKRLEKVADAELAILQGQGVQLSPEAIEPMVVDILTRTLASLQHQQHEMSEPAAVEQAEELAQVGPAPAQQMPVDPAATGAMPGPGAPPASLGDMQ